MSQFIEELRKADKVSAKPMGFKTSRRETSGPRPRLIARKVINDKDLPELKNIADAVLLVPEKSVPPVKTIKSITDALPKIPWGIYFVESEKSKISALIKTGCDFFIFPATSAVVGTQPDDDTGKIIEIEASLDDGLIRAVSSLPVDAALVTDSMDTQGPLTWHRLMIFRHITGMMSVPVLIQVSASVAEDDIKALWNAGADGMIIDVEGEKPESLTALRAMLDKLPPRTSPGREQGDALLPYPREASTAEPEPEPEEDDDWE